MQYKFKELMETPTASLNITSNGDYDVVDYATANVEIAAGTQGIPVATKGSVVNNSIEVTPSATDITGYIVGETKTGAPVTVSASELVSGTIELHDTNVTDVTNSQYAQVIDANLISANIITGKTILGVSGSAIVPSGNIKVTNTNPIDVTNYATAQVVDANLVAENIAKDVIVLGITGTHEGGVTPTGSITITPNTEPQVIDVTTIATANINPVYAGVSTSEAMDANLLDDANIGKMYQFTGTTNGNYNMNSLYVMIKPKHNIVTNLTNCTGAASNPTTIYEDRTATLTFTSDEGCLLPDSITVTGATLVSYTKATGEVIIGNPTDTVTITIIATVIPVYTITVSVDEDSPGSGTVTGGGQYAAGSSCTITATPNIDNYFTFWVNDDLWDYYYDNPLTFTVYRDTRMSVLFDTCECDQLCDCDDDCYCDCGCDDWDEECPCDGCECDFENCECDDGCDDEDCECNDGCDDEDCSCGCDDWDEECPCDGCECDLENCECDDYCGVEDECGCDCACDDLDE